MAQTEDERAPIIVFDLGGVLIDWNPRHLYRKLFTDEATMEWFLGEVCSSAWNAQQDAGRSFAEAIEEAAARHPACRSLIEAYFERWEEMLAGPIEGAVAIFEQLTAAGCEVHALTNWSSETFPIARQRFAFLERFESILVSGEVGMIKPDPRIFDLLLERIGSTPPQCLYIDDNAENVAAAELVGFDVVRFHDADQLRVELGRRARLQDRLEPT